MEPRQTTPDGVYISPAGVMASPEPRNSRCNFQTMSRNVAPPNRISNGPRSIYRGPMGRLVYWRADSRNPHVPSVSLSSQDSANGGNWTAIELSVQ